MARVHTLGSSVSGLPRECSAITSRAIRVNHRHGLTRTHRQLPGAVKPSTYLAVTGKPGANSPGNSLCRVRFSGCARRMYLSSSSVIPGGSGTGPVMPKLMPDTLWRSDACSNTKAAESKVHSYTGTAYVLTDCPNII